MNGDAASIVATGEPGHGSGLWDRLGIWGSVACTIHCLIAPVLFVFLPKFASVWAHPASHALVALLVLPLAATVLRNGYRMHRRKWVAAAAIFGMGFILAGSVLPYLEKDESSPRPADQEAPAPACTSCCPHVVETDDGEEELVLPAASIATVIGSIFLIVSHIGNICACRCCRTESGRCEGTASSALSPSANA